MAGLGTLARNLRSVVNPKRAYLYLTELGHTGSPILGAKSGPPMKRLQYYPESISDTKAVNYQTKDIPGASLPLYQWVSGGERLISFTAIFTTDTDHYQANSATGRAANDDPASQALSQRASAQLGRLKGSGVTDYNIYIPAAITWLRRFMYPSYGPSVGVGVPTTKAPRKLMLTMPGTYISRGGMGQGTSGLGGIHVIMTQCDVTYQQVFPSGNPRIAEVSLAFAETPQRAGRVHFPRVGDSVDVFSKDYTLSTENGSGTSGSS